LCFVVCQRFDLSPRLCTQHQQQCIRQRHTQDVRACIWDVRRVHLGCPGLHLGCQGMHLGCPGLDLGCQGGMHLGCQGAHLVCQGVHLERRGLHLGRRGLHLGCRGISNTFHAPPNYIPMHSNTFQTLLHQMMQPQTPLKVRWGPKAGGVQEVIKSVAAHLSTTGAPGSGRAHATRWRRRQQRWPQLRAREG
jgi:hypothetical protein